LDQQSTSIHSRSRLPVRNLLSEELALRRSLISDWAGRYSRSYMTLPHVISKLTEFIELTEGIAQEWSPPAWFRGQAQANWPLEPKLFRFMGPDEVSLRIDFRRLGTEMIAGSKPADHWEWYFLAQHFGMPTRLLDWTESALFGLYFAVRERKLRDKRGNAAVWILDPRWLNGKTTVNPFIAIPGNDYESWLPHDSKAPITKTAPIAMAPTHVSRRVAV